MTTPTDYKRGIKAGMAAGAICGGVVCAGLIYPLTGSVPMSLAAVAISALGVPPALAEFLGDFIILGPLAGVLYTLLYARLPGNSSLTKALVFLILASAIQGIVAAIFWIRLYHPSNFYFIHLSTPLVFGLLLGWFWERFDGQKP